MVPPLGATYSLENKSNTWSMIKPTGYVRTHLVVRASPWEQVRTGPTNHEIVSPGKVSESYAEVADRSLKYTGLPES